jgi:hypothetical protein
MSMLTRRRALCSHPGIAVVWKMLTRARIKSLGSVSERRSPFAIARLTEITKKLWMSEREPSISRIEPPARVSIAEMMSVFAATWSIKRNSQTSSGAGL